MTDKEENIKSRLKLLINNIDEFDSKFVTYKAKTIKALLQSTLQFIKAKEQECEGLKSENFTFEELIKNQEEQLDGDNVIIERFLIASGKSKDITEPEEFEEVFQDIEQTYSEHEELNKECEELRKEINGYKTIIEKIRQEVQEDVTCESQECGCDNYEECIECLKNTILNIINEKRNDFVQDKMICKECDNYKQALDKIENYVRDNSDFDKSDKLTSNTGAYNILEIINEVKE